MITYKVKGMRVILPHNRKNTDVALTVKGIFHDTAGNKLSIRSKDITKSQAANSEFALDLKSETLTLPAGKRGKPQTASISQQDINSLLANLRKG